MDLLLRSFDSVMTFIINKRIEDLSICFLLYQKIGKKDQEKIDFTFQKEPTREPGQYGKQKGHAMVSV